MHTLVKIINKYNGNLCFSSESPSGFIIIECNREKGTLKYTNSSRFIKDICLDGDNSYLVAFGNNWLGKFEEGKLDEFCADTMISNVDQIQRSNNGNYYILNRNSNQLVKLIELPLCNFSSSSSFSSSSLSLSSSSVDSSSSESSFSSNSSSNSSSSISSESYNNISSSSYTSSSESSLSSMSPSSFSSSSFSLSYSSFSISSLSSLSLSSISSNSSLSSSISSESWNNISSSSQSDLSSSSQSDLSSSSSSSIHIRIAWIFDLPDYDLRHHSNIIYRESDGMIIFYNRINIHTIKDLGEEAILVNSVELDEGDVRALISSQFKPLYSYIRYCQVTSDDLGYSSSSSSI